MVEFYRARARGGAALIVLDCPCLDYPRAYKGPHQLRIDSAEYIAGLKELLDAVKSEGARVFMQLNYPRERAVKQQIPGAKQKGDSWIAPLATTMSIAEADEILEIMARGAVQAREIGYDGVEIQASYGDLISQLLSPLLNTRTDELGGSLENRSHFLIRLIQQVKRRTGNDFPLMVKLVCDEFVDGGLKIEAAMRIAGWVEKAGADAIVANAGNKQTKYKTIQPADSPFAPLANLAAQIKAVVNIPVVAIGKINQPDVAEDIISRGQADFVATARALVADPDFPRKAESGEIDEIRPCVACLEDCAGKGVAGIGRCCTVNPFAGHEFVWRIQPGPGEEKSPGDWRGTRRAPGGAGRKPAGPCGAIVGTDRTKWADRYNWRIWHHLKQEMAGLLTYQMNCLKKSPVMVRTRQQANQSKIAAANPDVVIVATGSRPGRPPIPGIDADFVVQARDLYLTGPPAGERIVIIGGGDIGCETADWLAAVEQTNQCG